MSDLVLTDWKGVQRRVKVSDIDNIDFNWGSDRYSVHATIYHEKRYLFVEQIVSPPRAEIVSLFRAQFPI